MAQNQFALLGQRRFAPFFVAQTLGAFNDNVFKQALVILVTVKAVGLGDDERSLWANLASALFILPFFLFSATAGQWAEKFEKARSIRRIKLLEIVIAVLAAVGFWLDSLPFLLGVLFLLGAQSTLFGPIKYAILPQALKPEELTGGNGLVETGTVLAILVGTIFGGVLISEFDHGEFYASLAVIAIAVVGYVAARFVPEAPATAPHLVVDRNPLRATLSTLATLKGRRAVLNSVLGISWFFFFGALFLAQLPKYAIDVLGGDATVIPLLLALFSLGIGAGSLLCETLSRRTVEIGLVPLGAIGMTVFGVDLWLAQPEASAHALQVAAGSAAPLDWRGFLAAEGSARIAMDLVLIGVFGGFFIVPLFALVQQRTPREVLSRVIAANNILNAAFIVVAAGLAIVLLGPAGLSIPQLFLVTAVLNAIVAIYIFSLVPEFLMRFLVWLATLAMYRIDVRGVEENVPDDGPALVVCNHVGYMDALLLAGAIPRPVRFVMYYKIFRIPVMNWVFRAAGAIPIAGSKEDPELMRRAFERIDAALAEGEIVGLFPEGGLTKDGGIATFRPGVEKILAARPVPVVPMALKNLWGSLFSRRDSALGRMRVPRRFRARIGIVADVPVRGDQATAAGLEARVRELRGDAA
ncbi:MAG: MFS transporter [Lysobacteraceae bacterium]